MDGVREEVGRGQGGGGWGGGGGGGEWFTCFDPKRSPACPSANRPLHPRVRRQLAAAATSTVRLAPNAPANEPPKREDVLRPRAARRTNLSVTLIAP